MALHYRILDEAKLELAETSDWYDQEREGLGRELLVTYRAPVACRESR